MSLLPEFAVAQLVMLEGTVCSVAELSMYLETFGYQEDPHAQGRWVFNADDAEHAECRLVVENEGELITVYGEAVDHFTNINYVVQKAGWHRCSVMTRDKDIEAKLLARLVSVDVTTASDDMPASTLQASMDPAPATVAIAPDTARAAPKTATSSGFGHAEPIRELDDSHHRIEQLTVRCNMAEERSAELESANRALNDDNNSLRSQLRAIEAEIAAARSAPTRSTPTLPASGASHTTDALQLVEAIERYLSAQIAVPTAEGAPLLADLQRLGYEPRLRLVKVG